MPQTMIQPQTTQTTLAQALEAALQQFRAGQLQIADNICREVLEQMPEQPSALHLQALIARQMGRLLKALALIQRAIAANSTHAEMHSHLGIILRELNRPEDAMTAFQNAVEMKPELAEAHANIGDLFSLAGRDDEAGDAFGRAVALKADYAEAWNNYGVILRRQKKFEQAAGAFRHAVDLRPQLEPTHTNLGNALADLERWGEAQVEFEHSVRLMPNSPTAWGNLAIALQKQDRVDEAVTAFRRATDLQLDLPESHLNLANAHRLAGQLNESLATYNSALALKPDMAEAYNGRGVVHQEAGQYGDAIHDFEQALALKSEFAAAHVNYATALLLQGDYANGFEEYEWRFSHGKKPAWLDRFTEPLWDGGDIAGKRILLHCDSDAADVIQCIRYAPLLADLGATVILECPAALAKLMQSITGIRKVCVEGQKLPTFHCHSPISSLPYLFRTTLETIPSDVPYLLPDPEPVEQWRQRRINRDGPGFRIGLAWSDEEQHIERRSRAIPLAELAPLSRVPGLLFYSLQKGPAAAHTKSLPPGLKLIDYTADLKTYTAAAALMANLDLVITTCSATAHLAGATGKQTWLLLPHVPDWRWLLDRNDSPWYPTMRLFRQPARGDWASVVEQVKVELEMASRR